MNINISDLSESLSNLDYKVFIALVLDYARLGVVKIQSSYIQGKYYLSAFPKSPLSAIWTRSYSSSTCNAILDYFRKTLNLNIIIKF